MTFYAYMVGQIYILNNPRSTGILCSSFKNSLVIFSIPLVNINSKKIVHFTSILYIDARIQHKKISQQLTGNYEETS